MITRVQRAEMARDIIEGYGGATLFARRLAGFTGHGGSEGVEVRLRNRAYKWVDIGVSPDWRGAVEKMLIADGKAVPPGFGAPQTIPDAHLDPAGKGEQQPAPEPQRVA